MAYNRVLIFLQGILMEKELQGKIKLFNSVLLFQTYWRRSICSWTFPNSKTSG